MNTIRLMLGLVLSLSISQAVTARTNYRTISGIVTSADESLPLEGVAVAVKGSGAVSGSQADGIYYIRVSEKDSVLVFSYPGYQPKEIKLSLGNEYNVVLNKKQDLTAFSPIGNWRGVFTVKDSLEIPFNFTIISSATGKPRILFTNGAEKFDGGHVTQTTDSLFIALDQFDNELAFKIEGEELKGVLRRQDKTGTPLSLHAERNIVYRFPVTGASPAGDITGTYDISFQLRDGKEEKAVGLFKQTGNKLTGTFLRVTGDSRFLEGVVQGNEFHLSSFIGSSPAYYKGRFNNDGTLSGEIAGARGSQSFTGKLNEEAALPDPYKLTFLKEGYTTLDFTFPDANGKKVSINDQKFDNKVVVIAITGTWCPNCVDEAAFLAPWYKENKKRGVEVIALHYERQVDHVFVQKVLNRFRNKFNIEYEQLIAGPADKQFVATSLPALNTFLAFPTTIILDKNKKVAQIHTGYTGPATGKYYEEFKKEFNATIDGLLK